MMGVYLLPQGCVQTWEFLKGCDEENREAPGLCIIGPTMILRCSLSTPVLVFSLAPPIMVTAWLEGGGNLWLPCPVMWQKSVRWPCCLPQNMFADEELEVLGQLTGAENLKEKEYSKDLAHCKSLANIWQLSLMFWQLFYVNRLMQNYFFREQILECLICTKH